MLNVIIPSKNREHLVDTLKSLRKSTKGDYKVIVITPEDPEIYMENVEIIVKKFDTSIKAMKHGMEKAKGDILLTHDDVIFPELYNKERDWLLEMQELSQDERIGIITTMNGWGVSGEDFLDKFRWVGTWFMYIPERVINKCGYLDTEYTTGDDIDYTFNVVNEGYKIFIHDYWVDHHRSGEKIQDSDMANTDIVKINGEYFKKKWKLLS